MVTKKRPTDILGGPLTNKQITEMLEQGWNECPCGALYWIPRKGPHTACSAENK